MILRKENSNNVHVLLIDCLDEAGLIHKVSGVLYEHKYNIINNREFVDTEKKHFYMRTAFEGEIKSRADLAKEVSDVLPAGSSVRLPEGRRKNIVVLATSEHHCLAELLIRNAYQEINADVQAVVSNHETLKNLTEQFKIPFHHVPNNEKAREDHEQEIKNIISTYNQDYLVLAKYMRVLSPGFVNEFDSRIINIHHSFLPAFEGANPYRQAYERGVKIIGATAHFITDELDKGPIIVQSIADVDHTYNAKAMKQAGRDIEKITLVKALRLVCDDRVFLNGNKTIIFA